MTAISSVTPSSINGLNTSATGTSPVAKTADSGLVQTAVSLSVAGSIVATFGGGHSSPLTYDAAGLLNSLAQAGTVSPSTQTASNNSSSQAKQNSAAQSIVSTLSSGSTASGSYNSSGSLQSSSPNTTANWASALKANPSLAPLVISDSFNQGIVGTLSTVA